MAEVRSRTMLAALYPLGVVVALVPLVQVVTKVWPLKPGALNWRFGAIGLGIDSLLPVLLGMGIILAVAAALDHGAVVRACAVLSLAGFVLLAAALVVFGLDYVQLRATVPVAPRHALDVVTMRSAILAVLTEVVAASFGIGGWRATKGGVAAARRARDQHVGVVIPTTPAREEVST